MNQIQKRDRQADEIARIREVVGRHKLPDFVTGFDVRLGEFDGDPAMWIEFKTTNLAPNDPEVQQRTEALLELKHQVFADIIDNFDNRFPYFRFT